METNNGLISRATARVATMLGLAGAKFRANPDVDAILEKQFKSDGPGPGGAIAIARNGKTIYSRGYGKADIEHDVDNTPATVFHAASLAKQFTAMSILMLADRKVNGKAIIDLDDDVRVHIPELNKEDLPKITIRQMLQHMSGIRDSWALVTAAGWRLGDDVVTSADVLGLVRRMKALNFELPGERFSYSNTNYFLAGEIVMRKTGDSLAEFARKNIFAPLNMKSTRFIEKHGEIVTNRAYGYQRIELPGGRSRFEVTMPSYDLAGPSNLLTTVEDLLLWARNFDSDRPVGGKANVAEMQKAVPTTTANGYGLGLYVFPEIGPPLKVWHDGQDPGHRSILVRYPREQLTIALLCNVEFEQLPELLVEAVADVIGPARPPVPPPLAHAQPALGPATLQDLREYVGRYYSDEIDTAYDVMLEKQSLKIVRHKSEPRLLKPVGADKFEIEGFAERVLQTVTMQFKQDGGGKFNEFRMDDVDGRLRHLSFRRRP